MKRKTSLAFFISLLLLISGFIFPACASHGPETAASDIVTYSGSDIETTEVPEPSASEAFPTTIESTPEESTPEESTETFSSEGSTSSVEPSMTTTTTAAPPDISGSTTTAPASEIDPAFSEDHPEAPPLTWMDAFTAPEWSGSPYAVINGNVPFFSTDDLTPESYEIYYALDSLGRCTLAEAVVGPDLQPKEKRGNISMIKPTGWHSDRYSFVNGESLYNRCHLIAYYLTAENANPWNLVTGTSYMNRDGMNDFENLVGDYVKETGNHVRYRVTPKWTGENLICDGLLVEGYSIEDEGEDICFCIFAYNVQPGVHIDYLTGDNYSEIEESSAGSSSETATYIVEGDDIIGTYVLNKKSKKFHLPSCDGASSMSEKNREDYTGSRNALILDGYEPCPSCKP